MYRYIQVILPFFTIDRGRAEAMRMLLEVASVPYSEMAFTSDTWPAHKVKGTQSGLYTFSQGMSAFKHEP